MEKTLRELTEKLILRDSKIIEDEQLFRSIFFVNPIPLSLTRLSDGSYLYVNEAFCDASGYKISEVINKTPLDLGFYHNLEEREIMVKKISQDGFVKNFPVTFVKKGNNVLETILFATVTTINNVPYIIAAILIKNEICLGDK